MRTFTCRELGGLCGYRLYGETNEQLKIRMMQHTMDAHRDVLLRMSPFERDEMQSELEKILNRAQNTA